MLTVLFMNLAVLLFLDITPPQHSVPIIRPSSWLAIHQIVFHYYISGLGSGIGLERPPLSLSLDTTKKPETKQERKVPVRKERDREADGKPSVSAAVERHLSRPLSSHSAKERRCVLQYILVQSEPTFRLTSLTRSL